MKDKYNLGKWLNDEMENEELNSFKKEDEYDFYEKVKKYSLQLETPNFDTDSMLKNVLSSEKKKSKVVDINKNWIFKIAASVAILVTGIYFFQNSFNETIALGNGVKAIEIALPDSSKVTLNNGSKIHFSKWNWNNNRILKLSGEAYFRVAKGKKFEVTTSLGTVSVLGTQFNVKERNKRFDITCYEGKVEVACKKQKIIITKGQTVSFENYKKIINHSIFIDKPEWLNNEMAFEKEKLTNIIEEIERQFSIEIDLATEKSNQLFTGKIPTENRTLALQIIASTYHLKPIKISDDKYSFEKSE